jgi:hypothetical protein
MRTSTTQEHYIAETHEQISMIAQLSAVVRNFRQSEKVARCRASVT